MRLLLDTHLLVWAMGSPERLPATLTAMLQDPAHTPVFSVASLWELVIKQALGRPDFAVQVRARPPGGVARTCTCVIGAPRFAVRAPRPDHETVMALAPATGVAVAPEAAGVVNGTAEPLVTQIDVPSALRVRTRTWCPTPQRERSLAGTVQVRCLTVSELHEAIERNPVPSSISTV